MAAGDVSCSSCGHKYPPAWAQMSSRPPCPACGATALTYQMAIVAEVSVAHSVGFRITPPGHKRDSARRWRETDSELADLEKGWPDQPNAEAVFAAQRRLHHIFIELWSLVET